ncbi:Mariner Mos1 transposase [Araneus ventricosus]|uniref:Mariner Mos1 transposase n=1 Tax=Araneus ventricosus TaxID=182803 RepID=A0A4Y2C403_ARAVE|nr:Mariner Mos1 transposase [Araneus ventricosus]
MVPGEIGPSMSKPNKIYGNEVNLHIWCDQKSLICYETVGELKQQSFGINEALKQKRADCAKRHDDVVFQRDTACPHITKPVKKTLKSLCWDVSSHSVCSPDVAPSDNHFFPPCREPFL